ncbi:MAG: glutaredoxin family protein [Symbiobacteriia bacterium]
MTRRFLSSKGLTWEERNILTNSQYRQEMRRLTDALTVPILSIGERVVIGYNPKELTAAVASLQP